jgi:hypothetical protein
MNDDMKGSARPVDLAGLSKQMDSQISPGAAGPALGIACGN